MVFLSLSTMLKAKIIQSLQHHRSGNVTRVEYQTWILMIKTPSTKIAVAAAMEIGAWRIQGSRLE
ncbi:hypothetical protein A3465_08810 [Enterobacter roggenkampii]|nr:hypothetical protein A3465_08810 [Enterobacter roggenkampii]